MARISISKDFSEYPAGRYRVDGKNSGEVFRDDLLVPTLEKNDIVEINFDGSMGYGSSFLEEAFGGLVRLKKFSKQVLHQKLRLSYKEDPFIIEEVWHYIDEARAQA
ncbi:MULTISPECIES: STAS-like domain-containing protein [Pseudomonas]|uniref:STAS-like domain-containing protein n=1 Tax=Pseudomonas TaxID=286 RepID=UPI001AE2DE05|nr:MULTISPECIES: STAS-like domain-containing protein [unclassified Pseudomonas]